MSALTPGTGWRYSDYPRRTGLKTPGRPVIGEAPMLRIDIPDVGRA